MMLRKKMRTSLAPWLGERINFDRWTCFSALILAALLFPAAGVAKMGSNQI